MGRATAMTVPVTRASADCHDHPARHEMAFDFRDFEGDAAMLAQAVDRIAPPDAQPAEIRRPVAWLRCTGAH